MWLSLIPGEEKHLPPLTVFGLKAHPLSLASSSDPWPCTPVPWENTLFIKDPGGSESTLHWFHQQIWTLTISAPITEHKYVRLLDKCGLVFKFFFLFFYLFIFFSAGPVAYGVPAPGTESKPDLQSTRQLQQRWILNPLCWAGDWTRVPDCSINPTAPQQELFIWFWWGQDMVSCPHKIKTEWMFRNWFSLQQLSA